MAGGATAELLLLGGLEDDASGHLVGVEVRVVEVERARGHVAGLAPVALAGAACAQRVDRMVRRWVGTPAARRAGRARSGGGAPFFSTDLFGAPFTLLRGEAARMGDERRGGCSRAARCVSRAADGRGAGRGVGGAPPELLTRHGSLGLRGVRHECESDRRTDDLGSGARIREVSASRHARRARHRRRAAIARSRSASIAGGGERRGARRRRARRGASASETTHSAEPNSHRLSRHDVWFARASARVLQHVCLAVATQLVPSPPLLLAALSAIISDKKRNILHKKNLEGLRFAVINIDEAEG